MMERAIQESATRMQQKITSLFYVYAFEGVILFISNGIVAFAIARYSVLRQRYTVQLAQVGTLTTALLVPLN
uniref:G_PROTEIN_RECEP_F1_2 domain-containing protein n=1 Tax=Ascaris lumbricoides TaxID=6252 RepID=A0A0M3HYM5_ASCLU